LFTFYRIVKESSSLRPLASRSFLARRVAAVHNTPHAAALRNATPRNPPTPPLPSKQHQYYGETLQSTSDLKTSACCTAKPPPPAVVALLRRVPSEIVER
jgi:hypothetical protein